MSGLEEIIYRTITAFLLLWVFVHLLGKRTIFQKTYHLYIASITLGTLAGNLAFNIRIKFHYFIFSFVFMSMIILILNFLAVKNHRCRKWIAGKPTILIEKGRILEKAMKKIGYTLEDLQQALRGKDIFYVDEVEFAVLEVNGTLSALKKPEFQTITKQDLQISMPGESVNRYPVELILDGEVLTDNLLKHHYTEKWLLDEIRKRNLQISDISYAVVGSKGKLYMDLYRDHLK